MKKILIIILGLSLVVISGCGSANTATKTSTPTDAKGILGKCLTDKGAIFYGTERCSHCKTQKGKFGDQMNFVPFVDCDKNKAQCTTAGITGYPTRVFADGSKVEGAQELTVLASKAGCEYKE